MMAHNLYSAAHEGSASASRRIVQTRAVLRILRARAAPRGLRVIEPHAGMLLAEQYVAF